MQVFSKEQNRLVNIYVCIHKISYAFFWNFVHHIYILKKIMHASILKKEPKSFQKKIIHS